MLTMISILTLYRHHVRFVKIYIQACIRANVHPNEPIHPLVAWAIGEHSSSYLFRLLSSKSQSRLYFFFPANTAKEALPF